MNTEAGSGHVDQPSLRKGCRGRPRVTAANARPLDTWQTDFSTMDPIGARSFCMARHLSDLVTMKRKPPGWSITPRE